MRWYVKWGLLTFGVVATILMVRLFLFTSYYIPSKGMENTLLQGDRIIASKWSYGYRVPFISAQDPYRISHSKLKAGKLVLFNNPADKKTDKIEDRELFIGRFAGLAGDTIIVDNEFNIHPKEAYFNPDQKIIYKYRRADKGVVDSLVAKLRLDIEPALGEDSLYCFQSFSHYEHYLITSAPHLENLIEPSSTTYTSLHQLVIPSKGVTSKVEDWNKALLCNTILLHEKREAYVKDGLLYIDGVATDEYTFTQDYYWIIANNSMNIIDSRVFGFVPHNHIVAKPIFIWLSTKPGSSLFTGYRWNRIFKTLN